MEHKKNEELGHFRLNTMQSLRIEPNGTGGHELFIDGIKMQHVKRFVLEMGVDRLTTLEITMLVGSVDVDVCCTNPYDDADRQEGG